MTTTSQPAQTTGDGTEEEAQEGKSALGRALDVAGIIAGGVLVVILFDVLSGGKVTRWFQRKRGGPCEGCDEQAQAQQVAPEVAGDN